MKKFMIIGIPALMASIAHAQSSVTLYGTIDAGLAYVNNAGGKSLWAQDSGALSDTYFGLRGTEDLGNGLRAIFKLESGFNIGNGQFGKFDANLGAPGSGLFTRQAYVGLQDDRIGTLTLGRQFDSGVDYLGPLGLAGQAGGVNLAAHPGDVDNLGNPASSSNVVKYESPDISGFHVGGEYGFSNVPGGFNQGRLFGVGAAYANGPIKIAAAYVQRDQSGSGANLGVTSVLAPQALGTATRQRIYGVGGNYAFGPGTVGILWTHAQQQGIAAIAGDQARFDNIEINGTYGVTASLTAIGSYTYTTGRESYAGVSATPKWHSGVLGLDYSLSKRSDVYVAGVYQYAQGRAITVDTSTEAVSVGPNATSMAGMIPPSTTKDQVAVAVGVRHRF
ncbi:porin [Caballeronia sp. dw_19]|uniref:porin n=1 Tax=Caballeronia sp. dw_19 TaxID=2719791 RepID=UPI0021045903|nr:porin [Caballeronia sp. dw_19]